MWRPDTLRAKLTLWYVVALTVTLAAFAVLLYTTLGQTLRTHHDPELRGIAERLAQRLATVAPRQDAIDDTLRGDGEAAALVMVRSRTGELLYRSPVLQLAEPSIGQHEVLTHAAMHGSSGAEFFTVTLERSGLVRFICAPIQGHHGTYVQVGHALGDVEATLHAVSTRSMLLIPVVVLLTSAGGWLVSGRALAPIRSIDATLRAIGVTDLSPRVEVEATEFELRGLVRAINGLLERLERAFQDLRHFAADTSHQLQTPLTVMKNLVEDARTASPPNMPALLDDIDGEVDHLSMVISDLQTLSLADANAGRTRRHVLDFSALCTDAVEILEALGEAAGVTVAGAIDPGVRVVGEAGQLRQLVLNLGDNAVKYTPSGGRVQIRLSRHDTRTRLEIEDSGIGIPAAHHVRIFERFVRLAEPGGATRGSGLGLTIVKRIVDVHGGRIEVRSEPGRGTTFTVTLPSAPGDAQNMPSHV